MANTPGGARVMPGRKSGHVAAQVRSDGHPQCDGVIISSSLALCFENMMVSVSDLWNNFRIDCTLKTL